MLIHQKEAKTINKTYHRIVSVVPSQTELLYDLGLEENVLGITKFCIHPDSWFRSKKRVGGTKTLDIAGVLALKPDLVIANKEENVAEQIKALAGHVDVYVSEIANLDDALEMITDIGALGGKAGEAKQIVNNIAGSFSIIQPMLAVKAAYLIWREPYMAAGGDTFINDMLQRLGFDNVFSNLSRYPEVTVSLLRDVGCSWVMLSSEPYPFKQKHVNELQQQLPGCSIILVDGEMFSWYGSRLLKSADYFKDLISSLQPGK